MRKMIALAALSALLFAARVGYAADNDAYAEFLDEYVIAGVTVDGVRLNAVNYRRVTMNAHDISNSYSRSLAWFMSADPSRLGTKEERVAFWINAYNLAAIKMIVDHYPVDSIRSTKISILTLPWKKDIINVGGRDYSLDEIEHAILLDELDTPMAHFGVVCASVSCADLAPVPYTAGSVTEALDSAARAFVNNTQKGVRIDRAKGIVYVSKIFDWGEDDFEKMGGLKAVISKYLDDPGASEYVRTGNYKVKYMDYNWNTNEFRRGM